MAHRIKPALIAGALIFLLMGNVCAGEEIVGQQAPKITADRWLTAKPPTTEGLEGKVYVIEFWAARCPRCAKVIPRLNQLTNKYSSKEVLFIALSEDESFTKVQEMIRKKNINYCVGMDNGTSKKFMLKSIPKAFVINHNGTVVWEGHPADNEFEKAIVNALKKATERFLDGVQLGPFEDFRYDLSGSTSFARAYHQLKVKAKDVNSPDSKLAIEIIAEIESRINKKIEEANNLLAADPTTAFEFYQRIVKNYAGAAVTVSAQIAYDKLKNDPNVQNEITAAETLRKTDKLLARCSPCRNCDSFNPSCEKCVEFNETAVSRAIQILTDICKKYENTNAARVAQKKLTQFHSKAFQLKKPNKEPNSISLQSSRTQIMGKTELTKVKIGNRIVESIFSAGGAN